MATRRTFHLSDRRHLWDDTSSSSDEKKQQSNIEIIDLTDTQSESMMCSTNTTTAKQMDWPTYIPSTLQLNNPRYSILPAFPTSIYDEQPPSLLLANVPLKELDSKQRARRQSGFYPLIYSIDKNKFDIPSYFRDYHQSFMNTLIARYKIDEAILDYNLYRFTQCFQILANEFIRRHQYSTNYFLLDNKQKQYAFEFYLQIDVDLFFMKTCSFRQAKPRSINEGLFCIDQPHPQYGFSACNRCTLCKPSYPLNCRERLGPMIRFNLNYEFTFNNGYKTLLNCPANCQTRNLIYVMICPCRKFEYIGETSQRLNDRLRFSQKKKKFVLHFEDHRQHLNRMFHEFLLGERNIQLNQKQDKDQETLVKDRMLLYRHAVRCPTAMQIFLNFNSIYWCFAPLTDVEAEVQDRIHSTLPSSLILLDSNSSISIGSKNENAIMATATTRSDENVRTYMRNLPPIPDGYNFSLQQRVQQFQYFKNQHDLTDQQNPTMDLFNVAIVAILPEDASEAVRRFVEALFITHAETKLNTSGRLVVPVNDDANSRQNDHLYALATNSTTSPSLLLELQLLDREEWCLDLIFPHHRTIEFIE